MTVLINNNQHRNRFSDTKGNVVKLDRFASCTKTSPYTPCLSLTHFHYHYLKPYTPLSYISLEWVSTVTADRWWILWIPISSCSPSMEAGSKHSESMLQSTAPTTEGYWLIYSTDIQWSLGCLRDGENDWDCNELLWQIQLLQQSVENEFFTVHYMIAREKYMPLPT